jgi:hypothetical protein
MGPTPRPRKAKRARAKSKSGESAIPTDSIGIGDIVMWISEDGQTVIGPGRVCGEKPFGQMCVKFGDGVGCRRVAAQRLTAAPGGSTAPACGDDCSDC